MQKGLIFGIIAGVCLFASALPAYSQENLKYILLPTNELKVDWDKVWEARGHILPIATVEAYAGTTAEVLRSWCTDISAGRSAMAFATMTIEEAGIGVCPSAGSSELAMITVPSDRFSDSFGVIGEDESLERINIYLRSSSPEETEELFLLAKPYLSIPYSDIDDMLNPDFFFPHFCKMCGCC